MIYPQDIVTEGSRQALARGIRILQGNRLDTTDEGHVSRLADYMQLNGEHYVADMGCGFGAVSWLLSKELLPKAHFSLINANRFQLAHCPLGRNFSRRLEDMCATSIPAGAMDLVMFNYSLCHVDPLAALTEAARIAQPSKGKLFVYDYERTGGDNALTEKHLFAHFLLDATFRGYCQATGWCDVETIHPGGDDTLFRRAVNNEAVYEAMFDHLQPVIWRAHR
jgi:hypothetical protein